jgi:parallel beta-helix repeat protein
MKRLISRLVLLVVFCSVLFSSPRTCIANTSGPIYIRADGSVDPSTAPISSMDNVTYTFNGDIINNSIVVERSNIIIDGNGYTLQGSGIGKAFDLSGVNNVTIKNTDISARNSGRDFHPNYGIYLYSSSFNTISGNNITDNYYAGIYLNESSNNNIIGNNITKNYHGIWLSYSFNNSMVGNNITNSGFFLPFPPIPIKTHGIRLDFSSGNSLRNNVMADSDFNFGVLGGALSDFINDVDVSNSVDGKPVYYWVSRRDVEVPLDAGYVSLVNCTNVRIENLTLTKNMQGILLAYTNCTTIVGNNITNNWNGILLWYSSSYNVVFGNNITANNGVGISFAMCSNNTTSGNNITNTDDFGIYLNESSNNNISGNNITDNPFGICLTYSPNNTVFGNSIANNGYGLGIWNSSDNLIYHNNMVNIADQVYTMNSVNVWDDGVEGNYWSNYTGVDLDLDGIGDSSHLLDEDNQDHYPLMGMFHGFNTSLGYSINVISNSTIEDFDFFQSNSTIRIYVSGEESVGFCRICIPKDLISPPYHIIIDNGQTSVLNNRTVAENQTHKWIYFAYQHSTHEIIIIPESPPFLILPIFIVATLLAVIVYKRKHSMMHVNS